MMLQAASERGLLTPERWGAALKDGADLYQVHALAWSITHWPK